MSTHVMPRNRQVMIERKMHIIECANCSIDFGIGDDFMARRREDHQTFYCPNGHSNVYNGPNEAERLREQLSAARSLAERESERRRLAEGERAAARGEVTRIRTRVGNGVCPCCNRTFVNLGAHMAGQHPDFSLDQDEPAVEYDVADLSPSQLQTMRHIGQELDQGAEGESIWWFHRGTVRALERRGLVAVDEHQFVRPTVAGLQIIAAAGSNR